MTIASSSLGFLSAPPRRRVFFFSSRFFVRSFAFRERASFVVDVLLFFCSATSVCCCCCCCCCCGIASCFFSSFSFSFVVSIVAVVAIAAVVAKTVCTRINLFTVLSKKKSLFNRSESDQQTFSKCFEKCLTCARLGIEGVAITKKKGTVHASMHGLLTKQPFFSCFVSESTTIDVLVFVGPC